MRKLVIFNVGGALSSYLEFDDKKIIIDLGNSNDFSPIDDFLIPLIKKGHFKKTINNSGVETDFYFIDQLVLSHLDKDHISDYEKFRKIFSPYWMTCPNDSDVGSNFNKEPKQDEIFKMNIDLIGEKNPIRDLVIEDMRTRSPISPKNPLGSQLGENLKLYFIPPKICEENENLRNNYPNNISLVLFLVVGQKTVLLPGDILSDGMKYLIETNSDFKKNLNNLGVDFLIAPHHGLQTAFSEDLFREIYGNKSRLNIISEKIRIADSNENRSDVDGRYYSSNYSTADNDLNQYGVKTSGGHIVVDLETAETEIKQITDTDDLIKEFLI